MADKVGFNRRCAGSCGIPRLRFGLVFYLSDRARGLYFSHEMRFLNHRFPHREFAAGGQIEQHEVGGVAGVETSTL